ncbi:copper amine oxidase N-terminal domain-containing protein [Paenibacillus chondroitinus]|uniref:Copper amine oxidase N-terminal domain-containing protein n=1 Tax=Paenibacillus chondroitinus TaxID=59842 RepID=A0ABU6D7I3_9BACL|nr:MULTISPECIES: copper amine oxidase N-terminal domain-containing protein [Paenibacillus]MCY9661625.1 copper amine oxidase N-terminal domain-containing protein [Paenibacillus anseongense]MEB4793710.1 copper amine oxidase N-terminal domain-containing protein [Paenibacillus chondroitinus]
MIKLRSTYLILLAFILIMIQPLSAFAADTETKDQSVQIQLKLGEDHITINDQSISVETPYANNGVTLVPLRVITSAFGAALSWASETQTVGLTYNGTSISLQIGSTTATVNGKEEQIEVAPELKNGTTMVPLRFISEKFGASVKFDEATSTIAISSTRAAGTDAGGIDSDLGKTHIGNSYYGWSMKYPTGLVKSYQSFKEDYVSFNDANGEYHITISVKSDMTENMSEDALLDLLADETDGEPLLEKKYVSSSAHPYALIKSKDDGELFEYRAYQSGDKVYILIFTIIKEETDKVLTKHNAYQDLLNSFQMSFDTNAKTLKDLSSVKDGLRMYTDETYGISIKIPADWSKSGSNSEMIQFIDPKKKRSIGYKVTSKSDSDTLQKWSDRASQNYTQLYAPAYSKSEAARSIVVDGNQALLSRSSNTFDNRIWDSTENVYLIKGNYKYFIAIDFSNKDDLSDSFIQSTLQSIKIGKPSSSIGTIKDSSESLDRSKTSVVKNKNYNYTISIPDYWKLNAAQSKNGNLTYSFGMGNFLFVANDTELSGLSSQEILDQIKGKFQSELGASNLKETVSRTENIDGAQAIWREWEYKDIVSTFCLFQKGDSHYVFMINYPKAIQTEFLQKQLLDTIKSFQSTK